MIITYDGKTYPTLTVFCKENNISYYSITSYKKDMKCSTDEAVAYFMEKAKPPARRWTDEDKAAVRQMVAEGFTHKQIAEELGRTPGAISGFCAKEGIKSPNRKERVIFEEEKAEIAQAGKKDLPDLAKKFDCCERTVFSHYKKLGKYEKPLRHEEKIRELAGTYKAKEIADKLGISTGTVWTKASICNISLRCGTKRREWTQAELAYLREHMDDTPLKELYENLERSKQVVLSKIKQLRSQ